MKNVFYAVAMFITIACLCNPSFDNYFIAVSLMITMFSVIIREQKQMLNDK